MMLGCQFCQTNYIRRAILFLQFLHILNNILSSCHGSSSHYIISRAKHLVPWRHDFFKIDSSDKITLKWVCRLTLLGKQEKNQQRRFQLKPKPDWKLTTQGEEIWLIHIWLEWRKQHELYCWFPAIVSLLSFSHICHHCPEALPRWRKN